MQNFGNSLIKQIENEKKELGILKKQKYLSKKAKNNGPIELPIFMLSFSDPRRLKWDTFVIILAIWNCFYIPFDIAFQPSDNFYILAFNDIIDLNLMFYIDIFVNFRTSIFTKSGYEITN